MADAASDGRSDRQSLASTLCDIVRYAPLAILLDGPSLLPELAERGKEHMRNARAMGPVAMRRIERQLRTFGDLGAQAADLLRATGLVPVAPTEQAPPPAGQPETEPVVPTTGGNGQVANALMPGSTAPEASSVPVDELAIPDYDSLSAMQVVNRLPGLAPDELSAVRDYEASHRGRKTILNKVAQLQS